MRVIIVLLLFLLSCKSKQPPKQEYFDSTLVQPLSDSVASLYRTQ